MSQQEERTSRRRRRWTPEQKARIVRRHLQERVSLADLADETGAAPGQISQWCTCSWTQSTSRSGSKVGVKKESCVPGPSARMVVWYCCT